MATIFTLKEDDLTEKINMDELYEKQQQENLETLKLYQKILGRVHVRIKNASRSRDNQQFCTFLVPEVIIGVPKYDNAACIAFLVDRLRTNGFAIKYTHPNLLFISWKDWVPSYVRAELKKRRGIIVDGTGEISGSDQAREVNASRSSGPDADPDSLILTGGSKPRPKKEVRVFKDISSYVPSGNVAYNPSLLKKL